MTVARALTLARERLAAEPDSARADALRLLELILDTSAAWLFAHPDVELSVETATRFEAALERRAGGEPFAYIAGSAGFYGRTFLVTPAVLVPRPETEHIVMLALEHLRARPGLAPRLCDVGTGSGILAITLALELPTADVVALDVSPAALEVAESNARINGARERIRFVRSDLFAAWPEGERFDCIVANLPYVATDELLPRPAPIAFEPQVALDGGPDGLQIYERFVPAAARRLATGGLLLMEAGPQTVARMSTLANAAFPRARVDVAADYAGLARIVRVRS